ncbi:hypothetical protein BASA50_007839 [Batrachochytrium salamandrivorans]|uniref:Uncharacterized protein n=1 Tax=Batrachochytrium salamandrivorans TaxID=1357716 RepID=A0ABQ8F5S8_9FUNG|nr:hypothetical protein BASA62_001177 [Batrachochytrium salamandrivorans]KAH6592788.1 hypothetical protein BASA50_007839 [Batrachochytrium salamandrivorans]
MKFNVLVVAAMVITSVSAGRKGKSNKPVKKSGGDSMSAPSYNPLEAGEGTSQESDPNETGPASYSGDDGADKNSASNSVMAHVVGEPTKASNQIVADPVPACDDFVTKLYTLRSRIWGLDYRLQSMFPDLYKLMMANNGYSRNRDIDNWRGAHLGIATELAKMIENLTVLMIRYYEIWERFSIYCSVESFSQLSPKEMMKTMYFAKWNKETTQVQGTSEVDLMTFDEQDDHGQGKVQESNP